MSPLVFDDQLANGPVLPHEDGVGRNGKNLATLFYDLSDGKIKPIRSGFGVFPW